MFLIYLIWVCFGLGAIGIVVALNGGGEKGLLGYSIFLVVVTGFILWRFYQSQKETKDEEKKALQREEERRKNISNGTWDFPWQDFCAQCKAAGITKLNSPFCEAKAKAIADNIMKKASVSEFYYPIYDNKDRLAEYLQKGQEEISKKELEDEINKRRPQKAFLSVEQKKTLSSQNIIKVKEGKEKRIFMLDNIISTYTDKISRVKKAQEDMQNLAYIMANSASQTKTTSWATTAGIANGLAGPVAGVLAGMDAIQRNAEIEEQNRRNREAVNQTAVGIINGAVSLSSDINKLNSELAVYQKARSDLDTKIVIDGVEKDTLYKSLEISRVDIKQAVNNGVLKITAMIKTNYVPEGIPQQTKLCIDGTLNGKIYAGSMEVNNITLSLPLYGIECGKQFPVQVETISDYYAINNQQYRVEWSPNKLWLMEE